MTKLERRKIPKFISLITDYGLKDESVGVMKGVILNICPEANILDVTHEVEDFSVRDGAWNLWATTQEIPIGNHVVVVDPGVGSERKAVVIETKTGDRLIGPDNGVLIPAAESLGIKGVVESTNLEYMREPVSDIFHGRDIFCPNAAYSAQLNLDLEEFGKIINPSELVRSPYQLDAKRKGNFAEGEIIRVDDFGNIFTNIKSDQLNHIKYGDDVPFSINENKISGAVPYHKTFSDVEEGELVLTDNAYGQIQIAQNMGNVQKKLGILAGEKIRMEIYTENFK